MKNYLNVQNSYQESQLKEVSQIIRNGGLVLFPTETVYGIGTNGLDANAVEKVYEVKKRKKENPINLLVSNQKMVEEIARDISPLEYKLMETFFPGPFTIILRKRKIVPDIVTAYSDFVGIRMPSNKIAKKLVELSGVPIAAPSANISGKLSGTKLNDIINDFSGKIDFAIDGGESKIGLESTIVKVIDNIPHILRPGFVTPEQIKNVSNHVILEEHTNALLPSSKLEHYQLGFKSILVYYENNQEMIDKIADYSKKYYHPVILCCSENIAIYQTKYNIKDVISIASKNDLKTYSKNLFSSLQKASSLAPDRILIEGVKKEGLGIAIMNRLLNICDEIYTES